jgi:hypothetical protein
MISQRLGLVAGAVALCGAVGYPAAASLMPTPVVAPLKLSDIELTRAMRIVVALPAPVGAPPQFVISEQMPPNVGIAITEIGGVPHHVVECAARLRIEVNGIPRASVLFPQAGKQLSRYEFDPPVIVRPGDVLTLTFLALPCSLSVNNDAAEFSIGGWKLEPGDV